MKRIMAIMLSAMLICTCIAPVAFADETPSSVTKSIISKPDFNSINEAKETGMYGLELDEESYKIPFSLVTHKPNASALIDEPLTMSGGDKLKISTKFAVDAANTTSQHLSMGPLNAAEDNTRLLFGPYSGGLSKGSGAGVSYPTEDYEPIASPLKTWVTYDFVYDMVESDGTVYIDKYSLYINGEPSFVGYDFRNKDTGASFEASEIHGIYYGERGKKIDIHMADMNVTCYPEGCTEDVVLENPWEASGLGEYFEENTTDHTLLLTDLSLTDQQIADAAPEGWTFSRVSYDDATDGKIEYIKMVNGYASYYKRIVAQDYAGIKNATFTGTTTTNQYTVSSTGTDGGLRYNVITNKEGILTSTIKTNSPKSNNNAYINLSYPKLSESQNQICGLLLTDVYGSSGTYINGALSGRIAYEWSFMVPEFTTKPIACRMYLNGTPEEEEITGYKRWIPFQITNGVLEFNADNTVTQKAKPQTVLPGEWHHFVIIVDTNNDTIDIYQNGVLIGTRQFTQNQYMIESINGMEIGINTTDGTNVNVPHAINLDDFRIGYVSEDWSPETVSVTSSAEGITVNNSTSVILGNLTSAAEVTLPEGSTAVLSDGTLKVIDESGLVLRYYKICENEISLTGFDLNGLTTDVGEKTKTITIENNMAEPYSAVLILAAYSNDGALVSVDVSPSATVYTKQTKQLTAKITVTEDEPVAKFKAFLWENTDSAYPLMGNQGK